MVDRGTRRRRVTDDLTSKNNKFTTHWQECTVKTCMYFMYWSTVFSLLYAFLFKPTDEDECSDTPDICGENANCTNTNGSFYCQCLPGFRNIRGLVNFTGGNGLCLGEYLYVCMSCVFRPECQLVWLILTFIFLDHNECTDKTVNICGQSGRCFNLIGSYKCTCHSGYTNNGSQDCVGE